MAVQKSKKSISKRGMKKSNKFFKKLSLTLNKENNKIHIRHHDFTNYYKYKF